MEGREGASPTTAAICRDDGLGRWRPRSASFGEEFPELDAFVKKAIPLQHREGYFGKSFDAEHPGDDDLALLWGNGRLLVGLVEYYQLRHDEAALAAARRLGDFLVGIGPAFNPTRWRMILGRGILPLRIFAGRSRRKGWLAVCGDARDEVSRSVRGYFEADGAAAGRSCSRISVQRARDIGAL